MPYAKNGDINIYYEVEGEGPPLVLAHGLSGSMKMWRDEKYAEVLKKDYQLVLFDARGHGKSDKPHMAAAYGLRMANDVISVLDDLGIEKAIYFGYSMGATIGWRVALLHTQRFKGFILGGSSPYRSEDEAKVEAEILERMTLRLNDPETFIKQREELLGRTLTLEERNEVLSNDAKTLIEVFTSIQQMTPLTNDDLAKIDVQCLIYCGELDPRYSGAKDSTVYLPKGTFVSLTDLDHIQAFNRIDLALPHIKEFLVKANK